MAKKKQLAGKKTKLAKLPLTQALASQAEETAPWGPSPSAREPEPSRLPFSWRQVEKGAAGPLAAAYLHLVQDLATLKSQLQSAAPPSAAAPQPFLPPHLPEPQRLKHALRQARDGLRDLHGLLVSS